MNRIVLAFLALLAGLAAQVSPAAARLGGDTQIGATAADTRESVRPVAARSQVIQIRPEQGFAPRKDLVRYALIETAPRVSTVHMGIDRARE